MQAIDLRTVELMDIESAIDPPGGCGSPSPSSSATGTAASASVYFELEPGCHVGVHTDTAEEFLLVLEGTAEGLVGDEVGRLEAGQVAVVPAMVRHDLTNVGDGTLRVFGTFAGSAVISTFEEPVAPGGPQLFVIGAATPITLPLEAAAA